MKTLSLGVVAVVVAQLVAFKISMPCLEISKSVCSCRVLAFRLPFLDKSLSVNVLQMPRLYNFKFSPSAKSSCMQQHVLEVALEHIAQRDHGLQLMPQVRPEAIMFWKFCVREICVRQGPSLSCLAADLEERYSLRSAVSHSTAIELSTRTLKAPCGFQVKP